MYMMMNTLMTLLMQPAQGGQSSGSGTIPLLFLAGMFLVMWLFMIRPQAKKAKLQKQFNEGIQKGDRIVTIAGIHGRINKVNEDGTMQLEVSPGTYMTIEKSAISMEYTQALKKRTEGVADKK